MNEYPKALYRNKDVADWTLAFDAAEELMKREEGWGGLDEEKAAEPATAEKPKRGRPRKAE